MILASIPWMIFHQQSIYSCFDLGGVSKETGIPDGFMGLDCGPKSIEENAQASNCWMLFS